MESSLIFCRLNKVSCTFSMFVVNPVFHYYFAMEIISLMFMNFFFNFPPSPPRPPKEEMMVSYLILLGLQK